MKVVFSANFHKKSNLIIFVAHVVILCLPDDPLSTFSKFAPHKNDPL